jgi:hypothetical protein
MLEELGSNYVILEADIHIILQIHGPYYTLF